MLLLCCKLCLCFQRGLPWVSLLLVFLSSVLILLFPLNFQFSLCLPGSDENSGSSHTLGRLVFVLQTLCFVGEHLILCLKLLSMKGSVSQFAPSPHCARSEICFLHKHQLLTFSLCTLQKSHHCSELPHVPSKQLQHVGLFAWVILTNFTDPGGKIFCLHLFL